MADINWNAGDDLSDLMGSSARTSLPQDDQLARIRDHAEARDAAEMIKENCPSCRGTGRFTSWSGRTVGQCFKCQGKGFKMFRTSREQRERARIQAADRKVRTQEGNASSFEREHPEMMVWMRDAAPRFGFAASMLEAVTKYGTLTQGQSDAVARMVAKDAERAAQRAAERVQRDAATTQVDVTQIVEAFRRGLESGLKGLTLRFDGLQFRAKDISTIYINAGGFGSTYYGKIVDGKFFPRREATPEVVAKIVAISADPLAAAQAYGYQTSNCGICGRHLENKESVESGIGPVCAGRLGWTRDGSYVKVGDF